MKNTDEILSEAYKNFENKNFHDSIKLLKTYEKNLASSEPEFQVVIENLLGFNYLGLDDRENARLSFERALSADPNSSQACAGLAEVFFLDGQDEKAKIMFEYAAIHNPSNQFAVNGLIKVNRILKLPDEHNSLLEEKKSEVIDFRNVVLKAGDSFSKGDFADAINTISSVEGEIENELFERQQLLTELANMKATAYLNLGELDEAKAFFEKALNLSPESSTACWGLAEIFYRCRMYGEAKTMFEWALKHDERNFAAKEGLAKTISALSSTGESPNGKPTIKLASGKTIELG